MRRALRLVQNNGPFYVMPYASRAAEEGTFTVSVMMRGQRHLQLAALSHWTGFRQRFLGAWAADGVPKGPRQYYFCFLSLILLPILLERAVINYLPKGPRQ
eukprot:3455919-Pyramimonas_sp.AAC.1